MIQNEVYRLKEAAMVGKDMPLPAGQELEIVTDVVYVNGNMVPPYLQNLFYTWITNNPILFDVVTKNW
jgi:hypothetical protein|tara:strand:+ start:6670 stop:6873 length:204 start_codon:yes stop_codon:yes gene_type:complete